MSWLESTSGLQVLDMYALFLVVVSNVPRKPAFSDLSDSFVESCASYLSASGSSSGQDCMDNLEVLLSDDNNPLLFDLALTQYHRDEPDRFVFFLRR